MPKKYLNILFIIGCAAGVTLFLSIVIINKRTQLLGFANAIFNPKKSETVKISQNPKQAVKTTPTPTITTTPTPIPTVEPTIQPITKPTITPTPQPQYTINNSLPGAGYSRQTVQTNVGTFTLSIIAADLNTTRVIVDTASDSDCSDNCPVLPLATYAARSGAYAGINGSFFCPASYPSCAGKTNSFDTLLMNKNKVYFNSANNVYSVVPAVIFKDNWTRFVGRSLEWGRDTSVDAVLAMQPALILNNQIVYGGSNDPKFQSRGARCFIGAKGSTAYIGVIYNATMNEATNVIHSLGIENAINLDQGGSTAMWYNGSYIAGPGRDIPNTILFVRK